MLAVQKAKIFRDRLASSIRSNKMSLCVVKYSKCDGKKSQKISYVFCLVIQMNSGTNCAGHCKTECRCILHHYKFNIYDNTAKNFKTVSVFILTFSGIGIHEGSKAQAHHTYHEAFVWGHECRRLNIQQSVQRERDFRHWFNSSKFHQCDVDAFLSNDYLIFL